MSSCKGLTVKQIKKAKVFSRITKVYQICWVAE